MKKSIVNKLLSFYKAEHWSAEEVEQEYEFLINTAKITKHQYAYLVNSIREYNEEVKSYAYQM